jgi:hypothetical protein
LPASSLELLRRTDKWYLGSGDGLIWAPPFPAWHDTPGFWDEGHLLQYPIVPLFAISLLPGGEPKEEPRVLRAKTMSWTPEELTLRYDMGHGLKATEFRSAPGDRTLASRWEVRNSGRRPQACDVILWTAVDGESVEDDGVTRADAGVRLTRSVKDRKDQQLKVTLNYQLSGGRWTWAAYRSEHSGGTPNFALTPFYDRWGAAGKLLNETKLRGINRRGLVYLGLARRIRLAPGRSTRFTASVQVTPIGLSVPAKSGTRWKTLEREVPQFTCSDRLFTRYWWYRWYGLRLNAVPAGLGQYQDPSVCEGIGYFHQPISYSAMCHAREVRWSADKRWSYGVLRTFFDRLGPDGSMPGRVYLDHLRESDFYHGDWGGAIEDVMAVHPDRIAVRALYPQVEKYAEWLRTTRDREGSGMIDVVDQFETGQEYMSRYQAVDPQADQYGWENRLRLKGIDVTTYAYRLFRFLERSAPTEVARSRWRAAADQVAGAIRERMWDPAVRMFFDVNPANGQRTGVKAAVCFYPYLTDIVKPEHVDGLGAHLFNPDEFWTTYPAPSSSVDDPLFSPDAEWKGKRHVCPWNGRVWPMTNSHLIDALARVTREHRPDWALRVTGFLRRFIRMMSFDGAGERPNAFEHYHPYSGRGSVYRGIDDYQHSWVNDLLIRHVAGVLPQGEQGVRVDPLPFGVSAGVKRLHIANHAVNVAITPGSFSVRIDGKSAGRRKVGVPLEISW